MKYTVRQLSQRVLSIALSVLILASLSSGAASAVSCPEGTTTTSECPISDVQKRLLQAGIKWYDVQEATGTCTVSGDESLTGSDNIQKAYNYFIGKGINDIQTAAIVGNFKQESGLVPTIVEGGGLSQDPSSISSGWGIAQWTPGSKVIGIAKDLGITAPIYLLTTQLDIVYAEMTGTAPTGYKDVLGSMPKNDLAAATEFFRANFEAGTEGNRQQYAKEIYDKYKGSASGSVSGSNASCAALTAVNCTPDGEGAVASATDSLSSIRQSVVCITQSEFQKYESGTMKPGTDFYVYSENHNEEWCADFVSWVYKQAGYPLGESGWREARVSEVQHIGQKNLKFSYHEASSYTPVPGDIAVHLDGQSHVNIVVSVNTNDKTVTLIGGNEQSDSSGANTSSRVGKSTTSYSGEGIVGYVSPKE